MKFEFTDAEIAHISVAMNLVINHSQSIQNTIQQQVQAAMAAQKAAADAAAEAQKKAEAVVATPPGQPEVVALG
jgi:ABC-type glycerol-3-phosphate transport system substrate-binding protein